MWGVISKGFCSSASERRYECCSELAMDEQILAETKKNRIPRDIPTSWALVSGPVARPLSERIHGTQFCTHLPAEWAAPVTKRCSPCRRRARSGWWHCVDGVIKWRIERGATLTPFMSPVLVSAGHKGIPTYRSAPPSLAPPICFQPLRHYLRRSRQHARVIGLPDGKGRTPSRSPNASRSWPFQPTRRNSIRSSASGNTRRSGISRIVCSTITTQSSTRLKLLGKSSPQKQAASHC